MLGNYQRGPIFHSLMVLMPINVDGTEYIGSTEIRNQSKKRKTNNKIITLKQCDNEKDLLLLTDSYMD